MANIEGSASGSGSGSGQSTPPPITGTRPAGARDPAWKYAVQGPIPGSVICLKCRKIYRGGINRLKYHLAGISHRDAKACPATTEEIMREMNALLALAEEKKLQREQAKAAIAASIASASGNVPAADSEEDTLLHGIVGSLRGPRIRASSVSTSSTSSRAPTPTATPTPSSTPHSFFVPKSKQISIEATAWNKDAHLRADKACANFWYFNNLPFNVASSPYWDNLVTALTAAGKGYKAPSRKDLSERLLKDATEEAKQVVAEQKKRWQKYGCTILSDGWTDGKNRTIINFLVASNGEVVFLKSIDASNKVKNAETLSLMLEEVVMEVGIENVVQIITDNAAAYVAAGRLLEERHRSLFWTPCAAHCLDLLLEDIGKLDWVRPIVDDARSITKFIYNHPWVLSLMRDHTKGKELVRSGATRFATIFLTLQSINGLLTSLKQMFVSQAWLDSSYSKKPEGERIAKIIFDSSFAQRAVEIVKVSEPLVRVLRLVDGDQNPMGYIYEAMDRAKESIRNFYMGDSLKFDPIWEIVDRRWNHQLHQPIHAAGYFLNPRFYHSDSFSDPNGEVMEGLTTCIQRMVLEVEVRDLIIQELHSYRTARGRLFSSDLAIRGRTTQPPDSWWIDWGANTPHLQKLALRILCQPCSASHCERNWSLFEAIHTKKRNKLAQKRLNDLVFVQYNLRLRTKRIEDKSEELIDLDEIDPYSDLTGRDDRPPLFTEDEILDFERQAMEEVGAAGDIGLEDIDVVEEESLPSSSRMEAEPEPQAVAEPVPSIPSEEPQQSRRIRTSTSPQVFTRLGKRKM